MECTIFSLHLLGEFLDIMFFSFATNMCFYDKKKKTVAFDILAECSVLLKIQIEKKLLLRVEAR